MRGSEGACLRHRRSAIELWPESAAKRARLDAIAYREAVLDMEDALRCLGVAHVGGHAETALSFGRQPGNGWQWAA